MPTLRTCFQYQIARKTVQQMLTIYCEMTVSLKVVIEWKSKNWLLLCCEMTVGLEVIIH